MSYSSVKSLADAPTASLSVPSAMDSAPGAVAVVDLEVRLGAFVQWVLKKSCSGKYAPDASLKMMDRAWRAQKMLWRLRQQQVFASSNQQK